MRFNARFIPYMSINITLYIKVDLYYKISSEYHVFKLRIIYLFIVYIFTSIFHAAFKRRFFLWPFDSVKWTHWVVYFKGCYFDPDVGGI
jgi:hypothetical protein